MFGWRMALISQTTTIFYFLSSFSLPAFPTSKDYYKQALTEFC